MLRRVLLLATVGGCLWICSPSTASAQLSFGPPPAAGQMAATPSNGEFLSAPPTLDGPAVAEALRQGSELEGQRRWSEALTWYEDALRRFPQQAKLEERLHLTRMHYDLATRYGDNHYRDGLASIPKSKTLELYDEVLLKIQSHYVEPPKWQHLIDHGTATLMEALLDPLFLETNLPNVPQARVEGFRRFLRDRVYNAKTESRQAAVNLAAYAAQSAREQIGLNETAAVFEYVAGAAGALDPYSTFLSTGKLNEVYSQIEGNFVGLGIELKSNEHALLIVKVFSGGPADRAGIRAGDRIIAVDGRTTLELSTDQAANLLQGQEGTTVEVTIVSPGMQPRRVSVRREQVEVPSVDNVAIVDQAAKVGYLRLTCFQKTTSRDLDAALWKLHRDGMQSLIIDLRGNPGGLLNISVDVVDKFVNEGVIVSTRGRNPTEDYSYAAHKPGTWQVPLTVLIDGDSASASEIFAGAIRDHRRGTIVGARSYGKGSVQGIYPLNTLNAGIRLTTAKFYSPNGHPFSRVGVAPDVAVRTVAKPNTDAGAAGATTAAGEAGSDPALEAAVNVARQQVVQR
jgi:carboxyl-terminal processing protease